LTLTGATTFTHSSSNPLFSGSTLDVGNGSTFVQDTVDVLGVDTVIVRTNGTITHGDNSGSKDSQVYISATNMTIETGGQVISNGLGYNSSTGTGEGGDGAGAGGAGYGGIGGAGTVGAGGATYGSATAPSDLGSGGGNNGTGGGEGGGAIRLVVSNTLLHNGHIGSDGNNGVGTGDGGGSGGSIWIDVGTMTCSGGTLSADGGDGVGAGGGGGGGRIALLYTTYSGCAPTVAGSLIGNNPGSDGSTVEDANAPTLDTFTVTPANPTVNDSLEVYVSASYSGNISEITIYLDGSPPATGLVKTCSFDPVQSPAVCEYAISPLERGDHTITAIVTGADATTRQQGLARSVADQTTNNRVHLDRLGVGLTNVHFTLDFDLPGTSSGTLSIFFPVGFEVVGTSSATGTCQSGTVTGFDIATGSSNRTVEATKTDCGPGAVHVEGIYVNLPSDVQSYEVTWTNDNGFGGVYITDNDQVTVASNVDPSISFNVGTAASGSPPCSHTFAGNGGVVALGTLDTGTVSSSDVSSVNHICTRMSHNATVGAVITVRSLYAELRSLSTPADMIPAVGTNLSAGTEGYGLCVGSESAHYGNDPAADPAADDPNFDGSDFATANCTSSVHQVGLLATSAKLLWMTETPTENAFARVFMKASISSLTEAHDDYTDTLTFIMTATY